jgi:hypothetical protein
MEAVSAENVVSGSTFVEKRDDEEEVGPIREQQHKQPQG